MANRDRSANICGRFRSAQGTDSLTTCRPTPLGFGRSYIRECWPLGAMGIEVCDAESAIFAWQYIESARGLVGYMASLNHRISEEAVG